jgi:N-acetylmuramoyl-L-alanine amidase
MIEVKYLVIHTTASPQTWSLQTLNTFFRNLFKVRKENRGYHVVIEASGKVTRRIPHLIPSSYDVQNFKSKDIDINNGNSEHIAYIGGIDSKGKGIDNRTDAQKESMAKIIDWYVSNYPDVIILGHNQVAPKFCPCFSVPKYLKLLGIKEQNIYEGDNFNILKHNKL